MNSLGSMPWLICCCDSLFRKGRSKSASLQRSYCNLREASLFRYLSQLAELNHKQFVQKSDIACHD